MRIPTPECIARLSCELGEGPVWRSADSALWFVDIKGKRIHRLNPETLERRSWETPAAPGFLAPLANGKWIAGLKTGLSLFNPENGQFQVFRDVEPDRPENRLNDGFVDAHGRLWFGTMDDTERSETGALYCLEGRGLRCLDDGYAITNGPAISPDGKTLYHVDTLKRLLYAFDLTPDAQLRNKRVFAEIDLGYPDGVAVDAEGCLWLGLFGGGGVRRYSPRGECIGFVPFPVSNVTKIAFGGSDLRTAFATTAWKGLSVHEHTAQPLAGGLFCFEVDVPGLPQNEVTFAH